MKNILLLILFLSSAAGVSAQCLYLTNCPSSLPVCDYSGNDFALWNKPYWWDATNQTFDLSEAPCITSAIANDTCANAVITAKYLLFLDLDNDSIQETVIKSWAPPAPGTVNYNNYQNANYDGGEVRVFDDRAVAANEKYQFALQTELNGNALTARLRWNSPAAPNTLVDVELPYAVAHKIRWIFEDNFGNSKTCEYPISVSDCKKPTVVCLNGLSVNIMPTGLIQMWASDFLQYMEDNATPTPHLDLAIRPSGTGTGFPVDGNGNPIQGVVFNCNQLGVQPVELWSRDAAGNADYCETYVIVQDNANNCNGGGSGGNEPPIVVCLNGLSVGLQASGTVSVSATSLLQTAYDNHTPFTSLDFGVRRSGTGAGFPVDGNGNPIDHVVLNDQELGVVALEIWARDEDGNADYCETYVIVQEYNGNSGSAPTIYCLNGLSVNIMPTGMIQLWAADFLQYAEDDNTPTNQIQLAIRKIGTGTGFPVDGNGNPIQHVVYDCSEIGTQPIELWARDLDGNVSYCETYALIQDGLGSCTGAVNIDLTLCINRWCDNAVVTGVANSLGNVPLDANGCYHLDSVAFNLPNQSNIIITPSKDGDPANGVTPLDLVRISRHILGLDPLPTYGIIAADVNRSGSITSFDNVELKKLILGIYDELPNNTSWRFVRAGVVFPNPNNPFQGALEEYISIPQDSLGIGLQVGFTAIKVGDVDCDGNPGALAPANDRQVQFLSLPDMTLAAGATADIPVSFADAGSWLAMQAGWAYNPQQLEIVSVIPGNLPGLDPTSFATPSPGVFNMAWYTQNAHSVNPGETLFTLRLRARIPLHLQEALRLTQRAATTPHGLDAIGYDSHETPVNFQLAFRGAGTSEQANEVFQAQPNPTAAGAGIPVRLVSDEKVQVSIVDISGKRTWQQEFTLPAGMHLLDIPAAALPSAGVYHWQVRAGATVAGGKLVRGF